MRNNRKEELNNGGVLPNIHQLLKNVGKGKSKIGYASQELIFCLFKKKLTSLF